MIIILFPYIKSALYLSIYLSFYTLFFSLSLSLLSLYLSFSFERNDGTCVESWIQLHILFIHTHKKFIPINRMFFINSLFSFPLLFFSILQSLVRLTIMWFIFYWNYFFLNTNTHCLSLFLLSMSLLHSIVKLNFIIYLFSFLLSSNSKSACILSWTIDIDLIIIIISFFIWNFIFLIYIFFNFCSYPHYIFIISIKALTVCSV